MLVKVPLPPSSQIVWILMPDYKEIRSDNQMNSDERSNDYDYSYLKHPPPRSYMSR